MSGPLVFHMCVVLVLETFWTGVGGAQVSNAKVIRGTIRRDDMYQKEDNITVTAAGGVIHSPRYPNAYPRNLLLSWKLLSPPGTRIHLEFDGQFGLEEADNGVCRYDFVEVEDLSETSTIIWGRWCGQKAPPSLNSKANMLRVTFNSDDYFVEKPGFKIYFSMLYDDPLQSPLAMEDDGGQMYFPDTEVPLSLEELDRTIAAFESVEQLFRYLNPNTWKHDLDSIYTQKHLHYRSMAYHLAGRYTKVDLNRHYGDVKQYSCTPRNYSVNLREELRTTNAIFFPRCLLVQRCGGNCGCGTDNWNNGCNCRAAKTTLKLHEVLKYTPETNLYQRHQRTPVRWVIAEIFLTHHDRCECECASQPPR
ncbi:platelet-derived growth factor D isoform X2 [Takifugu flavidus]|uniref:platelet-derived growth factor D isoform X2 n=1 Tax=Takifugu flavidus TaxID=433684 RepID=UPI00254421E5|nr:platelet-derived growth factor D isoform X2 [Takifugu flavidus]